MPKLVRAKPTEQDSVVLQTEPNSVRSETQNDRTEFDGATDTTEQPSVGMVGVSGTEFAGAVEKTTIPLETEERGTKAVLKAPVNEAERRPFDDYPTEPGWTQALLDSVEFEGAIIEPAAGAGWMVQVLEENGYDVFYSDLERDGVDFLSDDFDRGYFGDSGEKLVDNIVTNPPYKYLDAFAAKALKLARRKVALLLPDFALVGVNRTKDLWQAHPPAKLILVTSKMKVLGKVSMFPHVWAVWDNDHVGPTTWEWATVPRAQRLDTSKAEPNLKGASK